MYRDTLYASLESAARRLSIPDDALMHVLEDEIAYLSKDARVRDYVRVIAIRRLRDRIVPAARRASADRSPSSTGASICER